MRSCPPVIQNFHLPRYVVIQSGYTLIELMITIAVVSILVAIGVVSYQVQLNKTQVMTLYQEINHFRLPYQILMDDGAGVTDFSTSGLNMSAQTKYCQFNVAAPVAGSTTPNAIVCAIQNLPYLQGQSLSLDYLRDGTWQCRASAGIKDAYLPRACQ
ncbi:MAG: pilin [Moraxellaceae bacterium]